jgi:hypothetical protein
MSDFYEGKSGVNVKRLVQNIADQYPFEPQVSALVELIANALDAKASEIQINLDKIDGTLGITDNGIGMDKRRFLDYHDFASSTKSRGEGIGFAGQGAKLALNFCQRVITETISSNYRGYSEWYLKGNDAPYKIYDGYILNLKHFGTSVTLYLDKKTTEFYDEETIRNAIVENYFPLVHCELRKLYTVVYEDGVRILLNGKEIVIDKPLPSFVENRKQIKIFLHNKAKVYGLLGKIKELDTLPSGVMVCTYGKVIDRMFFKKEPKEKEKIFGWIEAPYLIEAVTTDKCRFQKGNKTWEGFFRKAQSEFSKWLDEVGLIEKPVERKPDYINIEKEINSILRNIPEISSILSKTTKRDIAIPDINGNKRKTDEGVQKVRGTIGGETEGGEGVPVFLGGDEGIAPTNESGDGIPAVDRPRPIRGSIRLNLAERPDLQKESWFDGETVMVNKSHPAYIKAEEKDSLNYHILKAVILSIIESYMEKEPDVSYQKIFELQESFFRMWGER